MVGRVRLGPVVGGADGLGVCAGPFAVTAYLYDRPAGEPAAVGVDLAGGEVDEVIRPRCGSSLSTQAAGPKIAWVAEKEPDLYARARRLYMPSSWLVHQLTGRYVLDHHSASQCTPLYDIAAEEWYSPWVEEICPGLEMPPLRWSNEVAGEVHAHASALTGIPAGTPVVTGTIDAWAEALSVDAHNVGDLMLMYGTTMFLINTVSETVASPTLWGTVGALPATRNLAGGMATSGAITTWLRDLFGDIDYPDLVDLAAGSPPGANGLLMLPYFAGERTPVMDPQARGVIAGLSLTHSRGDLYRAAMEATGYAVRHNITTIEASGGEVRRIVAVGGGAQGSLWTQIVSDITGREQIIPTQTIGASYGGALLAAQAIGEASAAAWNPAREIRSPRQSSEYEDLYRQYLNLYPCTRDINHALAARQVR